MLKLTYVLIPLLTILMSGCATKLQQEIPFEVIEEYIAFPTNVKYSDKNPQLIVISELDDIEQLEFAETLITHLDEVDFSKSFVLLVLRGQLPDSGIVKEVVRNENEVFIRTQGFDPGLGSVVVGGFTPPYQIISVEKTGVWNGYFNFLMERDDDGLVSKQTAFIP